MTQKFKCVICDKPIPSIVGYTTCGDPLCKKKYGYFRHLLYTQTKQYKQYREDYENKRKEDVKNRKLLKLQEHENVMKTNGEDILI